jgi:sulfopyruvate decarboxylase TPP-binding subunit
MGEAAPAVLDVLGIPHMDIAKAADLKQLESSMRSAYADSCMHAAFLQPELWL